MATPTIAMSGQTIQMTFTDATTDFVFGTSTGSIGFDAGWRVMSMVFDPSGADTLVVREGSVTGPIIARFSCTDTNDQKALQFGDKGINMKPCIEGDDITLTTPANAILTFLIA